MAGNAACGGDGQARVSPVVAPATRDRCRLPPTTSAACAINVRAAGDTPSIPSSPIPMIDSQRPTALIGWSFATGRRFAGQTNEDPHSWRHDGGERPRPANGRPPGPRPRPVVWRAGAEAGRAAGAHL